MTPRALFAAVACAAALAAPSMALAASSGTVSGRLMFYQNQGNFCPSSRDCSGTVYPQSQFNTNTGVAHVKVYVRDPSDAIKGQGTTDANGNFTVSWTHLGAGAPPQMRVTWSAEHKDGRFTIRAESGGLWNMWTYLFTVTPSSNTNIGTKTWGSAGSPHRIANVYDGAKRMWYDSLTYSGRMVSYFTNVDVRAFDTAGTCPTSCARGAAKQILLDPNSAYSPQARIMHEMGHIASYLSHNGQSYAQQSSYAFGGAGGWTITSAEWGSAQFEEAIATFFGDRAIYWRNARAPHTCIASAVACGTNAFNTETSTGTSCATNENRWPLTVMRYLEDLYDTNSDFTGETVQAPFWYFFDTLASYPEGTANFAEDEPLSGCTGGASGVCDPDGRSGNDFYWRWWWRWSIGTTAIFTNNCSPVGD